MARDEQDGTAPRAGSRRNRFERACAASGHGGRQRALARRAENLKIHGRFLRSRNIFGELRDELCKTPSPANPVFISLRSPSDKQSKTVKNTLY